MALVDYSSGSSDEEEAPKPLQGVSFFSAEANEQLLGMRILFFATLTRVDESSSDSDSENGGAAAKGSASGGAPASSCGVAAGVPWSGVSRKSVVASNTWLQRPQRTQPSEMRSWSRTTLKVVVQDGQRVTRLMLAKIVGSPPGAPTFSRVRS